MTQEDMSSVEGQQTTKGRRPHRMDGGYGWIVVIACFIVHMIQIGYIRAFGLLFVKFLDEFGAPVSYTSTVMGIQSAVFSLISLLVLSALIDVWTIRGFGMIGASLSALGVCLSSLAMNVEFLIFTQSILFGIGNALTFGPGIVLLGRYFKKRLALANSIANAGVSAGAVVMPVIITQLMENFDFRGSLIVLGGILFQVVVCTALYRDPGKPQCCDEIDVNVEEFLSLESLPSVRNSKLLKHQTTDSTPSINQVIIEKPVISTKHLEEPLFRERTFSNYSTKSDFTRPSKDALLLKQSPLNFGSGQIAVKNFLNTVTRSTKMLYASTPSMVYASLKNLASLKNFNTPQNLRVDDQDKTKLQSVIWTKLCEVLDVRLFKNPHFCLICVFTPLCMCGSALAISYIPALAEEMGLNDQQSSLLVTVCGALDILSRIVPGVIAELGLMKQQHMVAISFFILGIIFQFTVYCQTFGLLMVFSCLYGLFGGVYFSLLTVILIEFVGFDLFPKVFGFVQVFHGASAAVCYPLLGALKDITGTYTSCFHFLGACMIVGSLVLCLEPLIRRRQTRLQREHQEQLDNEPSKVPLTTTES